MTLKTADEFRKIRLCPDLGEELPEDILPILTTLYYAWQSLWSLGGEHLAGEDGEVIDFVDMLEQYWPSYNSKGDIPCYSTCSSPANAYLLAANPEAITRPAEIQADNAVEPPRKKPKLAQKRKQGKKVRASQLQDNPYHCLSSSCELRAAGMRYNRMGLIDHM